jgi:hypothetical protein
MPYERNTESNICNVLKVTGLIDKIKTIKFEENTRMKETGNTLALPKLLYGK